MAQTRDTLAKIDDHVAESMGVRSTWGPVRLSPTPRPQDIGRRPSAGFGKVAIAQVGPDPQQPRVEFSSDAIERLAASIRDQGQLSPIRVRWSVELGKWLIIAGERRWRAVTKAGLERITSMFIDRDMSESEIRAEQLVENLLGEDLNGMAAVSYPHLTLPTIYLG